MILYSVTRLGDFIKIWATNFLPKLSQIFEDLLSYYENNALLVICNCCGYFWANSWINWATLYSSIWSHWILVCGWCGFALLK